MLLRWPHRLPLPSPQVQSAPAVLGGRAQLVVPPLLRLGRCAHRPAQASPKRASMPPPSRPACLFSPLRLPLLPKSTLDTSCRLPPVSQVTPRTGWPFPHQGSSQGLRGFPHSKAPPGSPWVLS